VWDEENVEYIGRHQVERDGIEEILAGDPIVRRGRDGRYLIRMWISEALVRELQQ